MEVDHTMGLKDGVIWHELKQYDHKPIINGETVYPDVSFFFSSLKISTFSPYSFYLIDGHLSMGFHLP